MLIGILSDTHDRLTTLEKALEVFRQRKVDAVIHAGDLVAPFAARRLKDGIAVPLHVIYGNNDGERRGLGQILPQIQDGPLFVEAAGKHILVQHALDECRQDDVAPAHIIVTGHTHETKVTEHGGKLYINPGECCGWVTGKCTIALLDAAAGKVEIVELKP